jgi:hypothetical protein
MRTADGRLWQAPEQTAGTRVDVQGDRNVVITGNVGGNVTVSMTETSPRRIR